MIVIKNRFIPFGEYDAINLFGIVFTKVELTEKDKNHERIHTIQMLEIGSVVALFIIGLIYFAGISAWWLLAACPVYYVWSAVEYLWISILHDKQLCAYHDVSFEEEAYAHEDDPTYFLFRKPFGWIKYLGSESNHTDDRNCCK